MCCVILSMNVIMGTPISIRSSNGASKDSLLIRIGKPQIVYIIIFFNFRLRVGRKSTEILWGWCFRWWLYGFWCINGAQRCVLLARNISLGEVNKHRVDEACCREWWISMKCEHFFQPGEHLLVTLIWRNVPGSPNCFFFRVFNSKIATLSTPSGA